MEEIKGVKYDATRLTPHRGAKRLKVGSAITVLDDCLAIDDCRLAAKVSSCSEDGGIMVGPVVSVARENTRLTALYQCLGAIAVVCDLVNPMLALWRLIDRGSKLRLDQPEPCHHADPDVLERLVVLKEREIANPNKGSVRAGHPTTGRNLA